MVALTENEFKNLDKKELEFFEDLEKLDEIYTVKYLTYQYSQVNIVIQSGRIIEFEDYAYEFHEIPESIKNLTQLKKLRLENDLSKVINLKIYQSFANLQQLEKISFDNYNLETYESFKSLKKLTHFTLINSDLTEIPEFFREFKKLKNLTIKGTYLKRLPEWIRELTDLEVLVLSSNVISIFPESITPLVKLKILDLHENQIKYIPESIHNLKSLKCLNLEYNHIIFLPKSIGKLTALESLKLNLNSLFSVPESITKLGKLKNLELEFNDFHDIPESLRILELNGCEVNVFVRPLFQRGVGKYTSDGEVGYFPLYVDPSIRLHLYDKYISLNEIEKDFVGTFELKSGKILAQDPSYGWPPENKEDKEKQYGYTAFGIPVVKGKWYGYVIKEDFWTGSLIAVHEDFLNSKTRYTDWLFISSTIAVDSGIAGIFDFDAFKKCNLDDHEKCYEELISFEHRHGKIWQKAGIYSSSGGSDDAYPVYVYKNSDNKAVILWIDFSVFFLADIWNEVMKDKREIPVRQERSQKISGDFNNLKDQRLREIEKEERRRSEEEKRIKDKKQLEQDRKYKNIIQAAKEGKEFKAVGFWKTNSSSEVKECMEINWSKTRQKKIVLLYLSKAFYRTSYDSISICNICKMENGYLEYISPDGKWIFPNGYSHYVSNHNVKPPQELITDVMDWFNDYEKEKKKFPEMEKKKEEKRIL